TDLLAAIEVGLREGDCGREAERRRNDVGWVEQSETHHLSSKSMFVAATMMGFAGAQPILRRLMTPYDDTRQRRLAMWRAVHSRRRIGFNKSRNETLGRLSMLNRRQFVCAAAAGAAMLSRIPHALAQGYDLIIKGGRVIDPSLGIDATRDVAI